MLQKLLIFPFTFFLISFTVTGQKNLIESNKRTLILSAIKGTTSKADTIILSSKKAIKIKDIKLTGSNAAYFKIQSSKPSTISPAKSEKISIVFEPPKDFVGIANAFINVSGQDLPVPITGLSTNGLEGENEPPLSRVVEALGYNIDIGWKTLANHSKPELQGEELAPSLFIKAGRGSVEIIPVARYSPDFSLNFGYYVNTPSGPKQVQTGILAKAGKFPEHQTLFPKMLKEHASFDPGDKSFGFYATSPDHSLYSEDRWNILFYQSRATHATRIYPIKDKKGTVVENTYLLCMEEAANGDFNDYVFLVKNIKPSMIESFTPLMNGKNLDGWYTWFQGRGKNNDPEKIFTIEEGGILHDTGKELGYLMTEQTFGNFHFKVDFKWGDLRWAPREKAKRDSGICYNIPEDVDDFIWPPSVECQIQEGDVGDFWLLEYSTVQVDGKQNAPSNHTQIIKKKDAEKPKGEWNTVEVISFNGKCVHIVNGVVVNYGENSSLVGGRILLQSEYAELYYRNIMIQKL